MIKWLALAAAAGLCGWWAWEKSHRRTHPVPPGIRKDILLAHESEFELYHNPLSLCSMKTRVCLAELRIPYEGHAIDLIETGSYQTLSREFLAVNPAGTVPVLVHRGHPIYESHEQIRYAAAQAPPGSPSLVPADPALRREMEHWIDRSSLTDDPIRYPERSIGNAVPRLTLQIFAAMIEKIPYRNILEGLLFHFDRRRPVVFLTLKALGLERMHRLKPLRAGLDVGRTHVNAHLDVLETQLAESGGPWILGETFSLADVSWMVVFERLRQVDNEHVFLGGGLRPACTAYWERLEQRPSYAEAILGYPHPLIDHGIRRLKEAKAADPALRDALEGNSA
jgi:tetrachloro-p-hydroquinone reductive dehalogenase